MTEETEDGGGNGHHTEERRDGGRTEPRPTRLVRAWGGRPTAAYGRHMGREASTITSARY